MGFSVHYPENSMLCTDNAAMIGITACHKYERKEFNNPEEIDRLPRWKVDQNVIDNHKLHSKM